MNVQASRRRRSVGATRPHASCLSFFFKKEIPRLTTVIMDPSQGLPDNMPAAAKEKMLLRKLEMLERDYQMCISATRKPELVEVNPPERMTHETHSLHNYLPIHTQPLVPTPASPREASATTAATVAPLSEPPLPAPILPQGPVPVVL